MALSLSGDGTLSGVDIAASGLGKVLQVVNGTTTTQAVSSSSTLSDTGLSVTITPTSASSLVLVLVSQNGVTKEIGNTACRIELLRGSTSIAVLTTAAAYTNNTNANGGFSISANYLDSPATTSAVTYKTQFNSTSNIAQTVVQWQSARSTITAIEVAA